MSRRFVSLLVLVSLIATVAVAQPRRPDRPYYAREGRWDFSLQTRYTASQSVDHDNGSSLELEDDLGWGFGFGYNLTDRFNLGLAFGWRSVPYTATAIDATDPDVPSTYGGRLTTTSMGVTADWNILQGPFTPYVTGSAAWLLIDSNVLAGWTNGCWWDPWWGYICGAVPATYGIDTGAYSLGFGGRFEVSNSFYVRVGYEHAWLGTGPIDGTDVLRIDLGLMN
jgi:hypothetical protein